MRYLFMTLFLAYLLHPAIAQDSSANKPNTIYIEGLGIGMRYSTNCERQFQIKESNWGFYYQASPPIFLNQNISGFPYD
ncbi:MAG: hypothetical protein IPQ11_03935 [Bacteroidetes bacterium]|nr:hypothetical protein [Bacteroidota bacterium]